MVHRILDKHGVLTEELELRAALVAGFLIGMEACEKAISNGHYLQAGALLRQEIETIVTIDKVKEGKHVEGRQNKITHLTEALRIMHGELSAAAHVAKRHVVVGSVRYVGDIKPEQEDFTLWRYYPQHNRDISTSLFGAHLTFLVHFFSQLIEYVRDMYDEDINSEEIEAFNTAVEILETQGFLKFEPYAAGEPA